MDPKNKFTAETVRQLQQSLEQVAPHQATELSKQQAVRELSPQIMELRSKGYSWAAVAAMLSEGGVPVSVAALRTYLRRVRAEAASEPARTRAKRSRDGGGGTHAPERPAPSATTPSKSGATLPAMKLPQPAAPPAPAAATPTATGSRREPEPRRSTSVVKPDTESV